MNSVKGSDGPLEIFSDAVVNRERENDAVVVRISRRQVDSRVASLERRIDEHGRTAELAAQTTSAHFDAIEKMLERALEERRRGDAVESSRLRRCIRF